MEISQHQAERHDALIRDARSIVDNELIVHDGRPKKAPGFILRWRLRKAIRLYEQAIQINPQGWSSMWVLGKIYQRLGEQTKAFEWFHLSHKINPTQPDVAREAGIAALDSGRVAEAVYLCHAALKLSPDDLGLQSNLALAYLMAGDDAKADECARVALRCAPEDKVTESVLNFVRDVAEGRKPRPKSLTDAFPYE